MVVSSKSELLIDISWLDNTLSFGGHQSSENIINSILLNHKFKKENITILINKNIKKKLKLISKYKYKVLPSNKYINFIFRLFFLFLLKKKNKKQIYFCLNFYTPIFKYDFEIITLFHDMQWKVYPENFSFIRILWLNLNLLLCKTVSDKIFFTSQHIKNQFLNFYFNNKRKLFVVYLPFFITKKNAKFNFLKKNSFYFILSSHLKHKNLDIILKIFSNRLVKNRKKLVVAGFGKKLSTKEIIYLGRINEKLKIWLFKNCYAYLQPSLYEGFGMTVVEAMMFSKYIITSNIMPFKEISRKEINFVNNPKKINQWKYFLNKKNIKKNQKNVKSVLRYNHICFSNKLYKFLFSHNAR